MATPLTDAEIVERVHAFIDERASFTTALLNSLDDTAGDYSRWSGHAQARRQLAEALRWPVPYADKDGNLVDDVTGKRLDGWGEGDD